VAPEPEPPAQTPLAPVGEFGSFFDATYPWLVKVAVAVGASIHDAEEAASDTMVYLYQRWEEIVDPRAYARKAVITNVAKICGRDRQRRKRTIAGGHLLSQTDDGTALTAYEDREWVTQHLAELTPAQREAMAGASFKT
jgi:DNA-directed RNA polymerase specialized sigma24 family protein